MSRLLAGLARLAIESPHHVALRSTDVRCDYSQLWAEVERLSALLAVYQGKTLALWMENSPAWVLVDLACINANVCCVPIPPFFTQDQVQHALSSSGAVAIINDTQDGQIWTDCCDTRVYLNVLEPALPVSLPAGTSKVTYTSGTTGQPKGVCLSQAGMEQVTDSLLSVLGTRLARLTGAILPLAVLLENIAGCYTTLMAGGCYDIRSQAELGLTAPVDFMCFNRYLATAEISSCILVPELLRGLIQAVTLSPEALPALGYVAVGGSKVSAGLLAQARETGLPVYQGYGLSESASVVSVNTPSANREGSVGQLLPHIQLHISDQGEINLHDPAFLGYVGDRLSPALYSTHDLGQLDEDGYLYVTGRTSHVLINALGRNISPEWPESELLTHPVIGQVLVMGDAEVELTALIVPMNKQVTDVQIQRAIHAANQPLPTYAQVRHWRKVPRFTQASGQMTANGRLRRKVIIQQFSTSILNRNLQE